MKLMDTWEKEGNKEDGEKSKEQKKRNEMEIIKRATKVISNEREEEHKVNESI